MSERISLAAVMILTHFGRIEAAFIPCLLQCKGLVLALKSCSLLPKHPHPKCGVRATSTQDIPHLMAKSSWFCSWRALLHPYGVSMVPSSLRGARGAPQWGEVQTLPGEQGLAQGTHLEWHHLPRAGQGCALSQPRAWDRSNPCIQPHDVLRESNIQGLQGSNHCWLHSAPSPARGQQRIWALQPQELLHSPGKSRAAAPLPSLNCHTLVPFPGNKCSFAGQKQKLK